jgi:hypothetical protein
MLMSRRIASSALAAALLLWTPVARAHDGHVHWIMGTVTQADATHVVVKTPGGETLSIAITPKTTVTREKKKVPLTEVRAGRRVVVDIGNGEDPLIAGEIRVGVAQLPKDE